MSRIIVFLCVFLWTSASVANNDDFFDLMGSAISSVGLPVNEYRPVNSLFLIAPRISNHGRNDILDFAFLDSNGANSDLPYFNIELQLRIDALQIVPLDNPLSSAMAKGAVEEIFAGVLDSLRSIEQVRVTGSEKLVEMGVLRVALAVRKNTVDNENILAVQGLLTTLLETRQAIYETYMGVTRGACDNSFNSKIN